MWKLSVHPSIKPEGIMSAERSLLLISPIYILPLAFSVGIWLAHAFSLSFVTVALMTGMILLIANFLIRKALFIPLSALIFLAIGILFGTNRRMVTDHDIALSIPRGKVVLDGTVMTVPEVVVKGKKETVSFVLWARDVFRDGRVHQTRGKVQVFLYNPGCEIRFGTRLRLRGVLEEPLVKRNPHSFDYKAYLGRQGIYKIFRGIGRFSVVRQSEGQANSFLVGINQLRLVLNQKLKELFPSPHQEVASALILGFRREIPREIRDAFIKTGTAHLLAISGLQISLVGGLFYVLIGFLRIPRLVRLALTMLFIASYAVIAGASIPVLRAGIMGIAVLLSFIIGEERNLKSALFFAFFLLLLWDPGVLFLPSFQLSFVAMASLIYILPVLEQSVQSQSSEEDASLHSFYEHDRSFLLRMFSKLWNSSRQTLIASVAASIALFPLLAFYFNLFSTISFLANLFVIPLCTMAIAVTLPLLLVGFLFPPLAQWLALLPLSLFKCQLWLVEILSKVSFGSMYLPQPPWLFFVLYYGFLFLWVYAANRPKPFWFRSVSSASVALVTIVFILTARSPSQRFTFFDFGKTEAAFFSFSNGTNCLINAGRAFPSDQAYWILRPFFLASGIKKLDGMFLTKVDGFHAGAFKTLKHHVRAQALWVPRASDKTKTWQKYIEPDRFWRLRFDFVKAGDRFQFGSDTQVYVETIAVSEASIDAFIIADGDSKILYVTSAKPEVFETLMERVRESFTIVFLPHHEYGFVSEMEAAFLKSLSCRYLVLNQRNEFEKLRAQMKTLVDSTILFLGETGAVEFYRQGRDIGYRTYEALPSPSSVFGGVVPPS